MAFDRNANSRERFRRNAQKVPGELTGTVNVTAPITNDGTHVGLGLSTTGGLQTVTNLLSLKISGAGLVLAALGLSLNCVFNETPTGTVNGSNTTFTLSKTPGSAALLLFVNGVLQNAGGNDFTLSGATITFAAGAIPQTGDVILATYLV